MDGSEEVVVQIQGGSSFTLDVGFADSVLEIKQRIQELHHIPVSRQTLMFHGVVLDDDSIIYDELAQDARLTLVIEFAVPVQPPPRPPQQVRNLRIVVEAFNGATVTVNMSPSSKVEELREKIEGLSHIPLPENGYFFIHKQVVMKENMSFGWHGVNSGDIIEVFPGEVTRG